MWYPNVYDHYTLIIYIFTFCSIPVKDLPVPYRAMITSFIFDIIGFNDDPV